MKKSKIASLSAFILIIGSLSFAFSRWYLVWLGQRLGGPEGLGLYGMLFAIATPLFVIAQLGLRTIFLSQGIAYPLNSYLRLRLVGALVGSLIFILFVLSVPDVPLGLAMAILLMKVFDAFNDLNMARIQYQGKILTMASLSLAIALLSLVFSTIGAFVTESLAGAVTGAAFASLAIGVLAMLQAQRMHYSADTESSGIPQILSSSLPVTLSELLASLLLYLPVWFLSFSADLKSVGIFTGISYAITAADLVGSSISKFLITPLRKLNKQHGPEAVIRRVNLLSVQTVIGGLLFSLIFISVGSEFFEWIYGPAFRVSPLVLCLFSIGATCVVLSHVQAVCLNVLNNYFRVTYSFFIACLLALASGVLFTILNLDSLVVGAAMVAAGSAGRSGSMIFSVAKIKSKLYKKM